LIESLDRRSTTSLTIDFDPPSFATDVSTGRAQVRLDRDGVLVAARGDRDFVDIVYPRLIEEATRGRPGWWWLRSGPFTLVYFAMTIGFFFLLVSSTEGPGTQIFESPWAAGAYTALVGFASGAMLRRWVRKWLPGFEITGPGDRGKGWRVVAIATTAFLTFVGYSISIIVAFTG
jgi:hypothetical protein